MTNKNVTIHVVDYEGEVSFSEILVDPRFQVPYRINQFKTTELKSVERNNNVITGIFVTTQKKGIPPAHTPGEDDDYTAIPLDEGQGLAYPNAILYDIPTNTLYIESNRIGLNEKRICEYFIELAEENGIREFHMELPPVLKAEAYDRVSRMVLIDAMECKIANPIQLFRDEMAECALGDFAKLTRNLNASRTVSVIVKSEEVEGGLTKREVLRFIDFFARTITGTVNRGNKLRINGRKRGDGLDNGELICDEVDFFLDKLRGSFSLDEPNVASHLQILDRKRGMISVYERHNPEVSRIIGENYINR